MGTFWEQLVFLARRDDFEKWMQILVFVAMIVVYSLSSILKSKVKKTEPKEGKEKPQRPRPAGPASQAQYRQAAHPQRRKITPPQPAVGRIAPKAERPVRIVRIPSTESLSEPIMPISIPQTQPDILEAPRGKVRMQKLPEGKQISPAVSDEVYAEMYLDEILLDYADPDELRRAILHYEILGKPLSLRGSSERIV